MDMIRFCIVGPGCRRINQPANPDTTPPGMSPTDASKQTTPSLSTADRQSKHRAVPDRHISLLPLSFRRFSGMCRISDTCSGRAKTRDRPNNCMRSPPPPAPGKTNEALTSYYGPPPGPPKLLQRLSTPSGSSPLLIHGNTNPEE